MFEIILLSQLLSPAEMKDPNLIRCAAIVGVEPTSRDFTYTEFKQFLDCRERTTGSRYGDA